MPANLCKEKIILTPTEGVTGLKPISEDVPEMLGYLQGELSIKKNICPDYIKPDSDGTQAKRVKVPLSNMPIAKSYVGASLLSHLMVSKYIDHLTIYRQLLMVTRQK